MRRLSIQLHNWALEAANQSLPSNQSVYGDIAGVQRRAQPASQHPQLTISPCHIIQLFYKYIYEKKLVDHMLRVRGRHSRFNYSRIFVLCCKICGDASSLYDYT